MPPNGDSRFEPGHFLALLLLLIAPGLALYRSLDPTVLKFAAGYEVLITGVTYWSYAWDKRSARTHGWRKPESLLHLLELLGGWPGAFIAQRRLRHKNAKLSYQVLFWSIVALHQWVAVDCLLGWPAWREWLRVVKLS